MAHRRQRHPGPGCLAESGACECRCGCRWPAPGTWISAASPPPANTNRCLAITTPVLTLLIYTSMAMSDSLACGGILAVQPRSHYTLSHGRGCQMIAGTPGLPRVYVLTTLWSECSPCNERKMPGKCGKAGLLAQQGFKSCVRLQWQTGTVLSHWPSCLYCKYSQRITAIQGD